MSGWDIKTDWADVIADWGGVQQTNVANVKENLDDWKDWGEGQKSTTTTSSRVPQVYESQNRDKRADWGSGQKSTTATSSRVPQVYESQNRGSNESRNRDTRDQWNDWGEGQKSTTATSS